ncbi:hypothetical protein B0H14DRAFT_2599864 [Mycena olivaceomarginata]|nr:hypothetical protein B0H14DRAFT_2599864 [Mycena olivaceomarginata]
MARAIQDSSASAAGPGFVLEPDSSVAPHIKRLYNILFDVLQLTDTSRIAWHLNINGSSDARSACDEHFIFHALASLRCFLMTSQPHSHISARILAVPLSAGAYWYSRVQLPTNFPFLPSGFCPSFLLHTTDISFRLMDANRRVPASCTMERRVYINTLTFIQF